MKFRQKKRHWLMLLLAMTFSISVYAQNITVTGTVTDETGEPLIGATIMQKGSSNGTATDIDGNYRISVPPKTTLIFSYVGYTNRDIAVDGRTKIDVTLQPNSTVLDEFVAIGYGTVRKKDLTGSVSQVSGKELAEAPVVSAAQALSGKAAGVNIVTQSGAPGAGVNITVRGGASITQSTKPLYIVDGFPMDDALSNIDINDIATIDVLKDASSTAIYGARGSNGIIVITTKSSKEGKTRVDYNGFVSIDVLPKQLDVMDNALNYVNYQYELIALRNNYGLFTQVYDNNYDYSDPSFFTGVYGRMNSLYGAGGPLDYALNMQKEGFGGSAVTQNHSVSITGGNDRINYLVSYNFIGNNGLLANHDYKRNSVRAKINSELWKGVKLDFSTFFYGASTHGGGAFAGLDDLVKYPINGGTMLTEDELLNTQTLGIFRTMTSLYSATNQLVQNRAATSDRRNRRLELNGGITVDFANHFTWRTSGNYVASWNKSTSFAGPNGTGYLLDPVNTGMTGSIANTEGYNWHIANVLTYQQLFNEKHDLSIMVGQEYSYSESEGNSIWLKKFPNPNHGLDYITTAEVSDKSTSHSHSNMLSFFARGTYIYDERYILTATMRADGSSKFAKGNKWGFFPSISGAWRVSQEKFWEEASINTWFNNLKLRAGYGVTGNNGIGDNLYTTAVTLGSYPMDNNLNNTGFVLSNELGNRDLKWETLHAANVGLDLGLFNNRLSISVDWYNNQISDMLMEATIPSTTGYTKQMQNVGKMRNRGWEVAINTVNIATRDFTWSTVLNLSFNRSKVIALNNGLDYKTFNAGSSLQGQVTYYAMVGQPLGDMFGYKYIGIYTTDDFEPTYDAAGNETGYQLKKGVVLPFDGIAKPGDMKFAADNEDGTQFTRQLQKIGNGTPLCVGGFGNTFSFKGFDLNVFMNFAIGNDIYNATAQALSPYGPFQNTLKKFGDNHYQLIDPTTGREATTLSRLKELNPDENSRLWSLTESNSGNIIYPSSYFVEDGSYLRISQLTLGYTFPDKWMKKAFIRNFRIYFTANNLYTFTKYSGYDPNVSSANDDVICTPGFDSRAYPASRSYVIGVNLSF
ncbi:MAG: TonB-dependent receptor [Muribaculaceae bacterium]|nr:TonB-dependent receptor [Muribaculaceae bacterium]